VEYPLEERVRGIGEVVEDNDAAGGEYRGDLRNQPVKVGIFGEIRRR